MRGLTRLAGHYHSRATLSNSNKVTSAQTRLEGLQRQLSSATPAMAQPEEQFVETQSKLGLRVLTLSRDSKLNSLNLPMIQQIHRHISEWEKSDLTKLILVKGRGRAFCAGGDVSAAAQACQDESTRGQARDFFKNEYETNSLLAKLRTPAVAFMDRITMGGGIGLAGHLPLRVATERTVFGMPETKIGLFPDVGATKRLTTLPGHVGLYLALTADSLSGVDCYRLGAATHLVSSENLQSVEDRLAELELNETSSQQTLDQVNQILDEYSADASLFHQSDFTKEKREAIDFAFGHNTIEEIIQALELVASGGKFAGQEKWAQRTLDSLRMRSPTSCKVALLALREATKLNIDELLQRDYRLACTFTNPAITKDFINGVNKVLIEKKRDQRPDWSPAQFADVKANDIQSSFFTESQDIPKLKFNKAKPFVDYPTSYGLPSEQVISQIVKGESASSGALSLTKTEVLKIVRSRWSTKVGLEAHVKDTRKTQETSDGVLKWIY